MFLLFLITIGLTWQMHIILPFKRDLDFSYKNISSYIYSLSRSKIITNILVGQQSAQNLSFAIRNTNSEIFIVSKDAEKSQYDDIKGYDETLEDHYLDYYSECSLLNEYDRAYPCDDIFQIGETQPKIYFNLVKKLATSSTLGTYDGNLGLSLKNETSTEGGFSNHFIHDLKSYDVISKSIFIFNYTGPNEGNLIIGDYLQNIQPDLYNNTNYKEIKTVSETGIQYWGFKADQIIFNDQRVKNETIIRIDFELEFILATPILNKTIYNDFFKEYIDNGLCQLSEMYSTYYYICDKYLVDFKAFPTLQIQIDEFSTILNFTYQDLFFEKDDKMICALTFWSFSGSEMTQWKIGSVLLRKYPILFDTEKKVNGFYFGGKLPKNPDPTEDIPVTVKKSPELIAALILISIFAFTVIIFSYRYIRKLKGRRKRATELDDEGFVYDELKPSVPDYFIPKNNS